MNKLFRLFYKNEEIAEVKGTIDYWRQYYYVIAALFLVVAGLPLVIMGALTFIYYGMLEFGISELLVYSISAFIMLNKRINFDVRETYVVGVVYFIGVFLLLTAGGNGAGPIYVLFAFVSAGFLLKNDYIKMFVTINIIVFSVLTILLQLGSLDGFAISNYEYAWFIVMFSMQFVGFMLIFLIHHTMIGIEEQSKVLIDNENKLNATLNAMSDGILVTTREGVITRFNPHIEGYYGVDGALVHGQHINDVFEVTDPETDEKLSDLFFYLKKNMEGQLSVNIQGSSRTYYVACKLSPIRDEFSEVIGYVCLLHDMTDIQEEELNLRQAQKMEAIGTMAGGVAHDFNNMLGGILGYAELSSDLILDKRTKLFRYNQEIVKTALKAAELTKQLLSYARRKAMKREPFDLNKSITDVTGLMERTLEKKIEIMTRTYNQPMMVYGDASLIDSALLNIGLNAKDAMPHGGELKMSVGKIYLNESYCGASQFDIVAGTYAHIQIKDQGVGMSDATIQRIFEPFFTTKEIGKGTGLGLSATYGTVVSHNGEISIKSVENVGTNVDVYLPLYNMKDYTGELDQDKASRPVIHGGKILVIDDEDVIRSMVKEILLMLGYEVIVASDGFEGLELFEKNKEDIRGVLLDMIMPKMNGREVYSMIKAIEPEAKVIMISGFIDETHIDELYEMGIDAFVKKPFTIESIIEALSVLQ